MKWIVYLLLTRDCYDVGESTRSWTTVSHDVVFDAFSPRQILTSYFPSSCLHTEAGVNERTQNVKIHTQVKNARLNRVRVVKVTYDRRTLPSSSSSGTYCHSVRPKVLLWTFWYFFASQISWVIRFNVLANIVLQNWRCSLCSETRRLPTGWMQSSCLQADGQNATWTAFLIEYALTRVPTVRSCGFFKSLNYRGWH